MDDAAHPNVRRAFRAEFILALAIIAMCFAIGALVLLVWRAEGLHEQEQDVVSRVRAARFELIAISQAQSDAEALASLYLARRDRDLLDEFDLAKQEARSRARAVRAIVGDDAEAANHVAQLDVLMEERLAALDAQVRGLRRADVAPPHLGYREFRERSAALLALLNTRIDQARGAANRMRQQLNLLGGALAMLSLIGSILALFALRRERAQWRLANALAEEARAQAAASDASKTRFLAVASHDMRQPLHALMLYINALERRVQSDEARDILAKMNRATRSMTGMFSTLLDLARIQGGVIAPEIVDFPLQDVLDRIAAESADGALEVQPTELFVRSDPALLERVLRNLVVNAVKHGGGKARIELETHDSEVAIVVADDGQGIAVEDQARVFDEFVRLEGRSEGLGLGLSIVKRIGELLNMPVALRSEPGRGARFHMRVPLAHAAEPALAAPPPSTFSNVATLVVDDDALAREAVAGALRDCGAEVRACADEDEADVVLESGFKPSLMVMDYRIDGQLRGLDVARRLSASLPHSPAVIVITGDTEQETLSALRASGFAWLIKPVDPRTLIDTAAAQLRAAASKT